MILLIGFFSISLLNEIRYFIYTIYRSCSGPTKGRQIPKILPNWERKLLKIECGALYEIIDNPNQIEDLGEDHDNPTLRCQTIIKEELIKQVDFNIILLFVSSLTCPLVLVQLSGDSRIHSILHSGRNWKIHLALPRLPFGITLRTRLTFASFSYKIF